MDQLNTQNNALKRIQIFEIETGENVFPLQLDDKDMEADQRSAIRSEVRSEVLLWRDDSFAVKFIRIFIYV